VNVLTAPLRPVADLLDITIEAVTAVGVLSVGLVTVLLDRPVSDPRATGR
jgi:hypothetical protein